MGTKTAPKKVSAKFTKNRATKNTVRFDEEGEDKDEQIMTSAYVRHSALEALGLDPEDDDLTVTITITAG